MRTALERSLANLEKANAANAARKAALPKWECAHCGTEKPGTVHQRRQTYCSKPCMAEAYQTRMRGSANPNFRDAARSVCLRCGAEFHRYGTDERRKYCSHRCYVLHARKPRKRQASLQLPKPLPMPKPPRVFLRTEIECLQCGIPVVSYPNRPRQFCSAKCFYESGGAQRAGDAAARAKVRYGAKKDANHRELIDEMRKYCPVYDSSDVGRGFPDGFAWVGNSAWHFFDIKNPKTGYGRRGLNARQKKWLGNVRTGPVFLLYTVEEARRFALGELDGLKFEVGNTDQWNV